MALDSMAEILQQMKKEGKEFWEIVLETDLEEREVIREDSLAKMRYIWRSMVETSDTYTGERTSVSGLVGGDAQRMRERIHTGDNIGGKMMGEIIAEALATAESNACIRKVEPAPTAGSCGVLPAVLIPLYRREVIPEHQILAALYTASGIGAVIAFRASISGAAGGCQAEIGAASAMAAGALVSLRGGTGEQICHAVAMALSNLMGLVCDPIAGLVEVPCVQRNVVGAVNAVSCADMALAGIENKVPVDQVIDAMDDVSRHMPVEFKETALGGLAATEFGESVKAKMQKDSKWS